MTPDPDASKAFYDKVVGWTIDAAPSGEMDYRMINAPDGHVGGVMRITADMQANGARPVWLGYLNVADVDAALAKLTEAGGKVMMPAWNIPNVGRIALVTDPTGAPFYVMAPTPPAGEEDATSHAFAPDRMGHVAWNELASTDHKAALGFYGPLFGFQSTEAMPMGEAGDYAFIDHHGTRIGAMLTRPDMPSLWQFYWTVPSVTKAGEAITAGGGSILVGPVEVPGDQHIIVASDPHGAPFGVVGALG
jgi:predicted enzyme related to lactoylglutathione lyase